MARALITMPQVAVLLPTSVKICRDMRRGVLQYAYRHGPWGLHLIEGREGEQKLIRMKEWGCTGIIGRLYTPELAKAALKARLPLVVMDPLRRCCARDSRWRATAWSKATLSPSGAWPLSISSRENS